MHEPRCVGALALGEALTQLDDGQLLGCEFHARGDLVEDQEQLEVRLLLVGEVSARHLAQLLGKSSSERA
eukprot:10415352-Heterocapsa_arctica.AAC.1